MKLSLLTILFSSFIIFYENISISIDNDNEQIKNKIDVNTNIENSDNKSRQEKDINKNAVEEKTNNEKEKQDNETIQIDENTKAKINIVSPNGENNVKINIIDKKDDINSNKADKNKNITNVEDNKENVKEKDSNTMENKVIKTEEEKSKGMINFLKKEAPQPEKQNESQTINIGNKYEVGENGKINGNTIKITDGVRSINININPEIVFGCNQKGNICKNGDNKTIQKKLTTDKKSNKQKKKSINKKSKGKNNKNENLIAMNSKVKSIRQLRENKEENNTELTAQLAQNNEDKLIENSPIYIINRIIGVDEDDLITEETIDKMSADGNGNVKVIGNNSRKGKDTFQTAYLGGREVNFVNQFDIIEANELKYGEVAFVNDYNE